eukprot:2658389-Prorocentrum_lima.AAC.1
MTSSLVGSEMCIRDRAIDEEMKAESLVRVSALRCFKGLTVPRLSSLYDLLGVCTDGGRKPRLEKDLCRALLKHVLPSLDDSELEALISKRLDAAASSSVLDQ